MNNNKVQRYEWEDSLLKAERLGLLPAPSVNMALRLAHAINWVPKDKNKPAGLYWDNESALKQVGSSRSTYFRVKGPLFDHGFFIQVKGNLIPQVPDLSHIETEQSQVETDESQVETQESQSDTPFTVNTFSDDSLSDDSFTDYARVEDASQPAVVPPAVSTTIKNESDKSNQDNHGATRRPVGNPYSTNSSGSSPIELDSPISLNEESSPIVVKEEGAAAAAPARKERVTDKWKKANGVKVIEMKDPLADVKPYVRPEKPKCDKCNKTLDDSGLCWTGGCW